MLIIYFRWENSHNKTESADWKLLLKKPGSPDQNLHGVMILGSALTVIYKWVSEWVSKCGPSIEDQSLFIYNTYTSLLISMRFILRSGYISKDKSLYGLKIFDIYMANGLFKLSSSTKGLES